MKKRLQKKLSLKNNRVSFLRNKATYFCGEKKIIEYYNIVKGQNPVHPLLKQGTITNNHFRFTCRTGVPLSPEYGIKYAEKLASVIIVQA